MMRRAAGILAAVCLVVPAVAGAQAVFDVRDHGAVGDGQTSDTAAINAAVGAAAEAGGGTVRLGAGRYLSGSIRLKSHVTLHLEAGATLIATEDRSEYDPAEPNAWDAYQDFGHSHWHNSLIWGEDVEDVAIVGHGLIDGLGLSRGAGGQPPNKAIALKRSRNVTIRDIRMFRGGHFAILATGVDNLTIDNILIDTNRDGIDIDSCRNVRVSNVSVNSPNDDAIVLKSSYALGEARPTEQVTITNSLVSGYDMGSLFDGTYQRTVTAAPDRDGPTGRIKFGTESNGGFRNITISNIVFDRSRGIALETVDGGVIEDVAISNITMRDVSNAPFFIRLGARRRGPDGTPVGAIRRVSISHVVVYDADPRYASIISGIPGHHVEDVRLSDIRILYRGGLTLEDAARQSPELVNTFFFRTSGGPQPREPFAVPELEDAYPEPAMFGVLPAYGFYIRHASGVRLDNIQVGFSEPDTRPAFVLDDVRDAGFTRVEAQRAGDGPTFVLLNIEDVRVSESRPVDDVRVAVAERQEF